MTIYLRDFPLFWNTYWNLNSNISKSRLINRLNGGRNRVISWPFFQTFAM